VRPGWANRRTGVRPGRVTAKGGRERCIAHPSRGQYIGERDRSAHRPDVPASATALASAFAHSSKHMRPKDSEHLMSDSRSMMKADLEKEKHEKMQVNHPRRIKRVIEQQSTNEKHSQKTKSEVMV
jgi:hypothetical protein